MGGGETNNNVKVSARGNGGLPWAVYRDRLPPICVKNLICGSKTASTDNLEFSKKKESSAWTTANLESRLRVVSCIR